MSLKVAWTSRFKRDYEKAIKMGLDVSLMDGVIRTLAVGEDLPLSMRDHALGGSWIGHRECHIQPDWLLIYFVNDQTLVLTLMRTGSHAALFGK